MTFDYAEVAADALETLTEFGADVTLRTIPIPTNYSPATGTASSTPVNYTRKAVIFDFGVGITNRNGVLIEEGNKRCLMQVGTKPTTRDLVILADGTTYKIKAVGEINPAGTPVLYDLHLEN